MWGQCCTRDESGEKIINRVTYKSLKTPRLSHTNTLNLLCVTMVILAHVSFQEPLPLKKTDHHFISGKSELSFLETVFVDIWEEEK